MEKKSAKLISFFKNTLLNVRVILFLICVLFSVLFWVVSEMNRSSNYSVFLPVKYLNLPKDKMLTGDLPKQLQLDLKAPGIRLFLLSLKKFNEPISVDFSRLRKVRENAYIIGQDNLSNLPSSLDQDVEITKIQPELIFFTSGNTYSKYIPVKANVLLEADNFGQLSTFYKCTPDKIKLSGDSTVINSIDTVFTEKIIINELENDIKQTADLIFPQGFGELFFSSTEKVEINIILDKLTDASLEIPIEILNPPPVKVKMFPEKIKVSYQVGLKSYESIGVKNFRVQVDFKNYDRSKSYLKIDLIDYPSNVRNVKIFPEKAEFILKK